MATKTTRKASQLEPMLVDAEQAGHLCDVSRAKWWKMVTSSRAPAPIRIGRLCKWRVEELRKWIAQGCPAINRTRAEQYRRDREMELSQLAKNETTGANSAVSEGIDNEIQ